MNLTQRILLAMAAAILLGSATQQLLLWPEIPAWLDTVFYVGGKIFVASLKVLVVPLVFISLVCGTCQLQGQSSLGRLSFKAIGLYLLTTAIAISIAILVAELLQPGMGIEMTTTADFIAPASQPISQVFINIFPNNPVKAMAEGNMLQVIVFAILIGLAIAGLIFGIMYLAKKFEENKEMIMFKWGLIQEGFSIAIDGLILWKDKAVNFIGNVFQDIWMSIKSLFSAVLTGIENGINYAIQGINSFLPKRFQIDEVDIGAKGMAAGLDEEKAAIAIERDAEAVEFAERKDELDERKATVIENFKLDEVPKDGKPLSLENAQAANAMTGEGIATATTEVKQGEKQGNMVNVVNQSSSPTSVSNTQVHNASGSPRDTDRTAVGLNAIAV